MMEKQNGTGPRAPENGVTGKPPLYSVETPYGFRLDLDFLKYVDDIEKGHTMKRVLGQRRSKGQRSSTLPRHLNLSGHGYRPSPWGSTGALVPRSHTAEPHHGYSSWAHDGGSPAAPGGYKSVAEMEASIRAFDKQPLGEHVRPSLIRATSMPLTVLLRKGAEATEEVPRSPDISSDNPSSQDVSGNLHCLTEALERVARLEEEVRVIPELKAQICILQEREGLRLGQDSQPRSRNRDASCVLYHKSPGIERRLFSGEDDNPNRPHEWRLSTDLDELLTVTSLQAKVAVLEQNLHQSSLELEKATALLWEQKEDAQRMKDMVRQLTEDSVGWPRAERVAADQDEEETENSPGRERLNAGARFASNAVTITANRLDFGTQTEGFGDLHIPGSARPLRMEVKENHPSAGRYSPETVIRDVAIAPGRAVPMEPMSNEKASSGSMDQAVAGLHLRRIQGLLEQQWECLCGGGALGESRVQEHPDPMVNMLQEEIRCLVNILSSYYNHGSRDGEAPQGGARDVTRERTSHNLHLAGVNHSFESAQDKPTDSKNHSKDVSASQPQTGGHAPPNLVVEMGRGSSSRGDTTNGDPGRGGMGGASGVEMKVGVAEMKTCSTLVESRPDPNPASNQESHDRERVDGQFIEACHFVKDHMDDVENPGEEMRRTLVVLFQVWFRVAAEEESPANQVAVYLKEVRMATPSVLPFLVNMADDNGNTALHYSVSHANYTIVSQLLDTGVCEVDLQNKAGYTAIMLASLTAPGDSGEMEVVSRLMEMGDVNARASQGGHTALMLAARHGRALMVRLLLRRRADPNFQDHQGATALMCACERGHTHVTRLLLDRAECDTSLVDRRGRTALSVAQQHGSQGDITALLQAHQSQHGTSL
ncbi:hypothetical protein DPEC_G00055700 [Dallia pectoralis]|uniref:Uncharacterized protein n=1 Tax=Dallia pectoralis TaxID=75939 RepID=A0ACC2H689_DALPE|nr:hypothetical protein DPEC_G00055700 [Dallia pectoralis]